MSFKKFLDNSLNLKRIFFQQEWIQLFQQMLQSNINCQRHPQNVISHYCTLSECNFRFLCLQCKREKRDHEHKTINKEQLIVKLENEINHQKYLLSFEGQCQQKIQNIRHFKRVINNLYERINQLNKSQEQLEKIHNPVYRLNQMQQELQKLKTGNLGDFYYERVTFSEDHENMVIEIFSQIKPKLQIINQDIEQANKILEQILNYNKKDQKDIKEIKDINEDKFYKNCQKMCIEYTYFEIKNCFQNDSLDVDQQIGTLLSTNCDLEKDSPIELEEKIKNIAISAYIVCKQMNYDFEVNDLFEIISQYSNLSIATNIIQDILNYK
ncbi:hypothetical protein pb186bvf_005852 [Paramecium bursaria]